MAMNTPLRLLLVDDSREVRRTISAVVADLVAEVAECADGDEVLARFAAFRPDLVLMDIRMPRMDGIRATTLLKAAHPEARVVIVSDFEQDDLRTAAREAGAEGFVSKSDLLVLRDLLELELERGSR
jgi:two-component system response regulator DegU